MAVKYRILKDGLISGYSRHWVRNERGERVQICSPAYRGRSEEIVAKMIKEKWTESGAKADAVARTKAPDVLERKDDSTTGDFLAQWLPTNDWAPSTRRTSESVFNCHVKNSVIWARRLQTLEVEDILDLLKSIKGTEKVKKNVLKLLKPAFNAAVRRKRLPANPILLLHKSEKPKVQKSRVVSLTVHDEALLLGHLVKCDTFWRAAILLGLDAGLGPAELGGLQLGDITHYKGDTFINISRNLYDGRIGPTKADARNRSIMVSEHTARALHALTAPITELDGHIFTHSLGTMSYDVFRREWHHTRKAAGIAKGYTFYALRHTMATRALAKGMPLAAVSLRLGHAKISTTLTHYIDAMPNEAHVGARFFSDRMAEYESQKVVAFPSKSDEGTEAYG